MPNIIEHKKAADQIIELLNSGRYKVRSLILSRPVFVICGESGKARTWSVDLANEKLPNGEQIAASIGVYGCDDVNVAEHFIDNDCSVYKGARHIAYTVRNRHVGDQLAERGLPVVFMSE
jgi:hypothetical protein